MNYLGNFLLGFIITFILIFVISKIYKTKRDRLLNKISKEEILEDLGISSDEFKSKLKRPLQKYNRELFDDIFFLYKYRKLLPAKFTKLKNGFHESKEKNVYYYKGTKEDFIKKIKEINN
ncbi:MAG: hypothetical protein V3575_03100 [Candidatus Absconditabacteria bacterium]